MQADAAHARGQKVIHAPDDQALLDRFAGRSTTTGEERRQRIVADPKSVERDLARLVLSVIELLRQLLERQAVRRVENGTLSEEEIERLGETLLKLEARMGELKAAFGLGDQELTLDLGPLRDLVSEWRVERSVLWSHRGGEALYSDDIHRQIFMKIKGVDLHQCINSSIASNRKNCGGNESGALPCKDDHFLPVCWQISGRPQGR